MRRIEAIHTEPDKTPIGGERSTHPAFGCISAARVSGRSTLFGSEFEHQHTIRIRIHHAEEHRSLSRDQHFERRQIVEVELSEAQWATFVSSLNFGSGVQCTLRQIGGEMIPDLPRPAKRADKFRQEARETLAGSLAALKELREEVERLQVSEKKRKELAWKIEVAERASGSSLEFVLNQFGEHMEATTEKAKTEVDAYILNAAVRAGLSAIAAQDGAAIGWTIDSHPPRQIEEENQK